MRKSQAGLFHPTLINVQIQPANVRTRNGYAKKGNGEGWEGLAIPKITPTRVVAGEGRVVGVSGRSVVKETSALRRLTFGIALCTVLPESFRLQARVSP